MLIRVVEDEQCRGDEHWAVVNQVNCHLGPLLCRSKRGQQHCRHNLYNRNLQQKFNQYEGAEGTHDAIFSTTFTSRLSHSISFNELQ
jgi:hypothetical protein